VLTLQSTTRPGDERQPSPAGRLVLTRIQLPLNMASGGQEPLRAEGGETKLRPRLEVWNQPYGRPLRRRARSSDRRAASWPGGARICRAPVAASRSRAASGHRALGVCDRQPARHLARRACADVRTGPIAAREPGRAAACPHRPLPEIKGRDHRQLAGHRITRHRQRQLPGRGSVCAVEIHLLARQPGQILLGLLPEGRMFR